jgi:hypothetical protein
MPQLTCVYVRPDSSGRFSCGNFRISLSFFDLYLILAGCGQFSRLG